MGKAVCWKKVLKFNWQGLELLEEGGWQEKYNFFYFLTIIPEGEGPQAPLPFSNNNPLTTPFNPERKRSEVHLDICWIRT